MHESDEVCDAPISVFVRDKDGTAEWRSVPPGTALGSLVQSGNGYKVVLNGQPENDMDTPLEHNDRISVKFTGHTNAR